MKSKSFICAVALLSLAGCDDLRPMTNDEGAGDNMSKVKHVIQALAKHGMETRVFICDEKGRECTVMITTGTNIKGVKLWAKPRDYDKPPK